MSGDNWDKCADIIQRLSSRVKNDRNQSAIVENCNTMTPLCIEKSFYQCKDDVGQGCCVEVCGNCSDPIPFLDGSNNRTSINPCEKAICDTRMNQQFSSLIDPCRHQFTSSKICDNKSEYIDYIVTNVLRQVVNHIPFDSLHQLSCCLPQKIEAILRHTDIDSDRLIRILVTEILQSYATNTGQLTDWYAFANLIKPFHPSTKAKDDDDEEVLETRTKLSSKTKKLPKKEKNSARMLNNHVKTSLATTPVSSMIEKEQSSGSIAFSKVVSPSLGGNIPSVSGTPSTKGTPQIMSTTNSMTPMSIHSKEEFTPMGSKYQSKTKSSENFVFNKTDTIDHHESLPFHEKPPNGSSPKPSQTQQQIFSDSHQYYSHRSDHTSNKSTDRSSSGDCILTIHHQYKHKRAHNHHTTSFDTPLSSHTSFPIKESYQKHKQTSADTSLIIADEKSTHTASQQNINLNSANIEQIKSTDLLQLSSSSDYANKHLHDIALLSPNNEQDISRSMNEVEIHEYSIGEYSQLPSLQNSNKSSLSSNDDRVRINTNSTSLNRKMTRINHYPNMLADFDCI